LSVFYKDAERIFTERKRIPPTPEGDLRLHRGERPVPFRAGLMDRLLTDLPDAVVHTYPDYLPFLGSVAAFSGVSPDQVVLGQGIEDLVRSLISVAVVPGNVVSFTDPTCAMFEIHAKAWGARPGKITIEPNPDARPNPQQLCNLLWPTTKLFILPNPGQPVDLYYKPDELRFIANYCRNQRTILAIDEAYWGFGSETAIPLINEFENVIVLRTFSKAFGGAGLRVGWAVGSPVALRPLEATRLSGEIAGPSMLIAQRMLDNLEDVQKGVAEIVAGRDLTRITLKRRGFKCYGTMANHVLIDLGDHRRAVNIGAALTGTHVRVKYDLPDPLRDHMLVTCGPPDIMEVFLESFLKMVDSTL
jgi:histidinol-phosphate aminotransferase